MEVFNGYVEMKDGSGVKKFELYLDEGDYYAYIDEEFVDDVFTAEDFAREYGLKLFVTLEDFKRGNSVDVLKVWT